jgi:hypothetical protein
MKNLPGERPKTKTELALESMANEFPKPERIGQRLIELFTMVKTTLNALDGWRCTDEQAAKVGSGQMSNLTAMVKEIEKERREFVAPFERPVKTINASFKLITGPLSDAKNMVSREIMDWRRAEQKRIDDENRKRAERELAERQKQIQDAAEGKDVPEKLVTVEREQDLEKPDAGTHVRKTWKFEIMDVDKVPMYIQEPTGTGLVRICQPDEKIIRQLVQAHHDNIRIPGVRIYADESLVARTTTGKGDQG